MSFADSENSPVRMPAPSCQRLSDCWPDFATELSEEQIETAQQKNRPGAVLKEAVGVILYSIGLFVLLMTIVQALRRG